MADEIPDEQGFDSLQVHFQLFGENNPTAELRTVGIGVGAPVILIYPGVEDTTVTFEVFASPFDNKEELIEVLEMLVEALKEGQEPTDG